MHERLQRNMVQRIDGRMVNAGMKRGMLFVCATGCCCGHTDRGYAPVPTDLYHQEWERRRLRNKVHLNQGGCLGPCPLANVSMLLLDRRPFWFHSLNDETLIVAYLPKQKILVQADAFHPRPGAKPLASPPPFTVNLVENIRRLKLDVDRVVHLHGGSDTLATVVKAAGL